MNRNAVIGIAVVALAPLYVGLSWLTGQAAHARVTGWEEEMTGQAGQLFRIAERRETQGIFSSSEEITLEFNPALSEAIQQAEHAAERTETAVEGASEKAVDSVPVQAPEPWRITIRNEIQHGPLPGFRSFGIARIESRVVLDEKTMAELQKDLGVAEPFVAVTRLGYLGGGHMKLTSPAFTVHRATAGDEVSWKGVEAHFSFGRNLDSFECDARAPGLLVRSGGETIATMDAMAFDCDLERVFEELYAGDASFLVKSIHATPKDAGTGPSLRLDGIRYVVNSAADGDYFDVGLKLGIDGFVVDELSLSNVEYNLALNHLHGATLAQISRKIRQMTQSTSLANPAGMLAVTGTFAEHVPVLLEHSPELVIDRIGFRMPEGEFGIKGRLKFGEFKREELAAGQSPLALLSRVDAGFDVWISEALLQKDWSSLGKGDSPGAAQAPDAQTAAMVQQQVAAMEQAGYVSRKNGRLEARIELRNGALTANGKPLGPPMQ